MRKAVDLIVEHAKPIPVEQAEAREELWTPEKEDGEEPEGALDARLLSRAARPERRSPLLD